MEKANYLTENQKEFIKREVCAYTAMRDATGTPIPRETLLAAARVGLLTYALPTEAGGGGASFEAWGKLLVELGNLTEDASFPLLLSLHAGVAEEVWRLANSKLRESHARGLTQGTRLAAFAYTEANDAFSFTTTLHANNERILVHGEKLMVTGGLIADTFVVYARTTSGDLAAVVVDRDDPGVEVSPLDVSGVRAAGLASLRLSHVHLPPHRVLLAHDALSQVQSFLNRRRLLLSCAPVGRLRSLVDALLQHLAPRLRYSQPVLDYANVQARLGRMAVAVRAAEVMTERCLAKVTRGQFDAYWDQDIVATKYFVGEQCQRVAEDCLRLLGGDSVRRGLVFERAARDFAGLLAGAGAQDILEVSLGTALVTHSRMKDITL